MMTDASAAGAPPVRPPRGPCSLCGTNVAQRRSLCWTCYRKLADCGLPLPPRGSRWQRDKTDLAGYLRQVPAETREALFEALLTVAKEG